MTAPTLPEFLLARIAEDEAIGRDWRHHPGKVQVHGGGTGYLAICDPARVLADCEAKRRIVEEHRPLRQDPEWAALGQLPSCCTCGGMRGQRRWPCDTLRALVLPYASHSDYREDWRP